MKIKPLALIGVFSIACLWASAETPSERNGPVASFTFENLDFIKAHATPDKPLPKQVEGARSETGKAIDFSDTDSTLRIPYGAAQVKLGHLSESKGISISMWVKHQVEARDGNHRILTGPGIDFSLNNSVDPLRVLLGAGAGNLTLKNPKGKHPFDGKWHHIVVSVDFSKGTQNAFVYIDGVNYGAQDATLLSSFHREAGKGHFIIGGRNFFGAYPFRGSLDDIHFFDRPLNAHEVAHLLEGSLSAGVDQKVWLPEAVLVQGRAQQGGRWSIVGPGEPVIDKADSETTQIKFETPGEYQAIFSENGSQRQKSVRIMVYPPAPPTVLLKPFEKAPYQIGKAYKVEASVSSPYSVTPRNLTWSQLSGPAQSEVKVAPSTMDAEISFPVSGLYEIGVTSAIGSLSGQDSIQFLVKSEQPSRYYSESLAPVYALGLDQPASRSVLLSSDKTENTGFRFHCPTAPLPKLIPGARPFTGFATQFDESDGVIEVFNRGAMGDLGNLRTTKGMGFSFWVKGKLPNRSANIVRAHRVLIGADDWGRYAKGLQLNLPQQVVCKATPKEGESWNLWDEEWHHCACSVDFGKQSNNVVIYIDGVERARKDYQWSNPFMDGMETSAVGLWNRVGGRKASNQCFNGAVDDLIVFNRPLTAADLQVLYRGPSPKLLADLAEPACKVEAGPNQSHGLKVSQIELKGEVQGVKPGMTYQWELVKGDGIATFASPNKRHTSVTLKHDFPDVNPYYGSYTFRLIARSPQGVPVTDEVTVSMARLSDKKIRALSATPLPGVHPRILFSPEDLPVIRKRCLTVPFAKASFKRVKDQAESRLSKTDSAVGMTYQAMKEGRAIDVTPGLKGFTSDAGRNLTGTSGSLYNLIFGRAFCALIEEDQDKLAELSTVLSRLATAHTQVYEPVYGNKLNHDIAGTLGLAYDMLASSMSEKERQPIRQLLSQMTRFRQTDGSADPSFDNSSNWKTFHDHSVMAALAIEGEEGYDPRFFEDNIGKLRDFFTRYGTFPSGCAHEGWGYYNFGLNNATFSALATARRDENFFKTTSLPNAIEMAFRNLAPWEKTVWGNGDIPGGNVLLTPLTIVAGWLYPEDPMTQYLVTALEDGYVSGERDKRGLNLLACLYAENRKPYTYEEASAALPLDVFCKDTGYVTARSHWSEDALHLRFRCRSDKYFLGHVHPDVNSFEFWSHQRHWVLDPGKYEIENDRHSTVLIDGVGGGGSLNWWTWPSLPGRFLKFESNENHVYGLGDAKVFYSYSHHTSKSPTGFVDEALQKKLGLTNEKVTHDLTWVDFTYPGTDPDQLPAWMKQSITADFAYRSIVSRPLHVHNPVEKAQRSAQLFRGAASNKKAPALIVITDDIQKDQHQHHYSWVANMPVGEIEVVSRSKDSLLLKHKIDPAESGPRLLVKLLGGEGETKLELEEFVVAASQSKVTRLRIDALATLNPKFQVMLYPHLLGDPLPEVDSSAEKHVITIGEAKHEVSKGL